MAELGTLDGFSVLRPLGHGAHGVRYLARDAEGRDLELWRIRGAQPSMLEVLSRRLDLLVALDEDALTRVHRVRLELDVPFIVVDRVRPLPELGYDLDEARRVVGKLATAVAAAHRIGLVHGGIARQTVGMGLDGEPRVDFFGLDVDGERGPVSSAPERMREGIATPATDVYALGLLLRALGGDGAEETGDSLATANEAELRISRMTERMCVVDPDARPSAREVAQLLDPPPPISVASFNRASAPPAPRVGDMLGRFELVAELGEGGMGQVFKARDGLTGEEVALKVLTPDRVGHDLSVRRFQREARLLSLVDSPAIARFVEANEDQGVLYLAMELVEGSSLKEVMLEGGLLPVERALDVGIEVCRALADVHDLGVVHRDVKPANVLLASNGAAVKLCDFGIARPLEPEDDVELTRAGTSPGTPWYMSPEQCSGREVDARTDVYALGATLFHSLAGEPPFASRVREEIILGHIRETPRDVSSVRSDVSDAVAGVVARALEKEPERRFQSAREMLAELERARFGGPSDIDAHPLPSARGEHPIAYRFEWDLTSPPEELWPYVSDTERFNRAVGLASVQFTHSPREHGVEVAASTRALGVALEWREHPFEWIAPRRLGVLREHRGGPFSFIRSTVDLEPRRGGGTHLVHTVEVAPRGPLGRAAASLEIGVRLRRAFARVYERIDETCALTRAAAAAMGRVRPGDPYEAKPKLSMLVHRRIADVEDKLLLRGVAPAAVEALVDHLREGTAQEVAHIRPLALALRFGIDGGDMIRACLWAAQEGALSLLWDILCPACRIPSSIVETLAHVEEHGHCDACDLDFDHDLARSVELVFRAHPSLRTVDVATYCIGGPAHSPHVLAQVRLAPGERFVLDPKLAAGSYRLAGRWSERAWNFRVAAHAPHREWHLRLGDGLQRGVARSLAPGVSRILLENDLDHEFVVRLERADARADAFTAAAAASHPLFRELFPAEVLSPGHLVAVSHIAIVFAEPRDPGRHYREGKDSRAFRELLELRNAVEHRAILEGGTLVKLVGHGVLAVFSDPEPALRATLALGDALPDARLVAHAGPAMMTTIDGRLDYFGRLMHEAQVFVDAVAPGETLVSEDLIIDDKAAAMFASSAPGATAFVAEGLLANRVTAADRAASA